MPNRSIFFVLFLLVAACGDNLRLPSPDAGTRELDARLIAADAALPSCASLSCALVCCSSAGACQCITAIANHPCVTGAIDAGACP